MSERPPRDVASVLAALRAERGALYAVLDPAQDQAILGVLRGSGQPSYSLYDGWAATHYRTLCPYLVPLRKQGALLEQIVTQGWCRAWGIFLTGPRDVAAVRRHLRRLLKMRDPDGDSVLCRFYDPLTMELFLTDPSHDYDPWVFGDVVGAYVVESHLEAALTFRRDPARAVDDLRWPVEITRRRDELLTHRRREFFVDQVERFLTERYPSRRVRLPLGERSVSELPRPMLRHMIDNGLRRAASCGVTDGHDQLAFVGLMFLQAPNFDEHLAVRACLDEVRPGTALMPAILSRTDDQVWRDVQADYDPAPWGLGLTEWGGVA